jgi:hypothetical protein
MNLIHRDKVTARKVTTFTTGGAPISQAVDMLRGGSANLQMMDNVGAMSKRPICMANMSIPVRV